MVLAGPSGCGIPTLPRMVSGLGKATGGDALGDNERASGMAARDRDVAMALRNDALGRHASVGDTRNSGPRSAGPPETGIARRIDHAAGVLRRSR